LLGREALQRLGCEGREHEIELQHPAPAPPAHAVELCHGTVCPRGRRYSARLNIASLILLIARFGLSPFGQTSTQFMIERQRNSRYGSFRSSSRSLVASSRLSTMKR